METPGEEAEPLDSQGEEPIDEHRRGAARKTRKVRIEERTPPSSVEEEAEVDLRQLEADALDE